MRLIEDCRLYTFIDTAYLRGRPPELVAQQLCDGGSDIIQLRAKTASLEEVRRLAKTILPVTQSKGVSLVINDYLSVAQEIGAEFCHLGQEDFFDAGHTRVAELGGPKSKVRIGLSSHAPDQAKRALAAGADYIAIGPVYATDTKPTAIPVTLDYVRWAAANVTVPWFAIGGINLDNLDDVLGAGARRVCIVSAILNSNDVTGACLKFKELLMQT